MFFVCARCLKLFILLEYKGILNPSSHSTFRKNKNKKCFYCLVNKNKKQQKKKVDAVFLQVVKAHHSLLAVAVVMGCCFNFRIYK